MKKFYMFLMMIFVFTGFAMAQTIENFESIKMNIFSQGSTGTVSVVANPDPTGANTSLNVGKIVRAKDGDPWLGWYSTLASPIDITSNPYVHIKVWKPRISPTCFKVEEGGGNSGDTYPIEDNTVTDQWVELVWDMGKTPANGEYVKIVLIPDFLSPVGLEEDITLYFDEMYVNNDPAVGSPAVQVIENFESIPLNLMLNGVDDLSTMTLVDNPEPSDLNLSTSVVQFERDKDGFPWDGFWSSLPTPIDVTDNKFVHVKVWKTRISPLKFKIEGGAAGTIEIFSKYPQTKTEEWEDIVFDFSEKTGTYPIIAFLPDFADPVNLAEDITIYFDDIVLNDDPTPMGPAQQVLNINMAESGITSGAKVWVSGTLGGKYGTWAEPGTNAENEMFDPDGDGIYSIALQLPDGAVAFKFFWNTAVGWGTGDDGPGDRNYTVNGDANLLFNWGVAGYTDITSVKPIETNSFDVFPNPTDGLITIRSSDIQGLTVRNILGSTLKTYKFQTVSNKQLDLSDLQAGVYFISVDTGNGIYTSKLIKR